MAAKRAQLEVLVVAVALAVLLGTVLSRTLAMADRSQQRAFATVGAHFVAGIGILQAESRLAQRRKLNAVGYPTGLSGTLQNDADCEFIWREAMQEGHAATGRFVADADGSGDRCEYRLIGSTAESSMRILYWPMGVSAATIVLGRDTIRITRGAHVHVEVDEVSS